MERDYFGTPPCRTGTSGVLCLSRFRCIGDYRKLQLKAGGRAAHAAPVRSRAQWPAGAAAWRGHCVADARRPNRKSSTILFHHFVHKHNAPVNHRRPHPRGNGRRASAAATWWREAELAAARFGGRLLSGPAGGRRAAGRESPVVGDQNGHQTATGGPEGPLGQPPIQELYPSTAVPLRSVSNGS